MSSEYVLSDYIAIALDRAEYEQSGVGFYTARIPACPSVIAFGDTLGDCERQLRSALEEWLLLSLQQRRHLPVLGDIDLNRGVPNAQMEKSRADASPIVAFFLREFELEEQAGFPRLSRVPDTDTKVFLHYYRALSQSDARSLKLLNAKNAAKYFVPVQFPIAITDAEQAALEARASSLAFKGEWRFMALKTLKEFAASSRREVAATGITNEYTVPDEVLRWIDGFTPCKAAQIRKVVKQAFASRFGFVPQNMGGGYWAYRRANEPNPFEVHIDYGGTWGQQLRYSVWFGDQHDEFSPDAVKTVQYEALLGAGSGDWDFITETTVEQDIALLVELIEYVVELPSRLPQMAN